MSDTSKALVTRLFEDAWGEGRLELLETLIDPGYRSHIDDVGTGRMARWTGHQILAVELAAYRSGLPDLQVEVSAVVAEGDTVIALFSLEGTNTEPTIVEPFEGARDLELEPTHMSISASGTANVRIASGRIVAVDIAWELLGPIDQIRVFSAGTLNVRDLVITPAPLSRREGPRRAATP